MNVLKFKRSIVLAVMMFILPLSNVGFSKEESEEYDYKQLISDVAVLYRQHKLAETAGDLGEAIKALSDTATKKAIVSQSSQAGNATEKAATTKKKAKSGKQLASKPKSQKKPATKTMTVTATAYTSHENQTDSTPDIAAWGDRLKPGMKAIAVSRDMLHKYGLKHRSKVRIKGLKGEYVVLDKMNKRWSKKIDIYMGKDLKKAFKWGRRKVELEWN